jgi:hypothetical protein
MRSVTEFANFTLNQALQKKNALTAEGKTPEEIQTSLGEAYKFEGDKLKYFINAIDVAGQNPTNLKRVLIISLTEGEAAPPKATKVEEMHYVPEYYSEVKPVAKDEAQAAGGRGGRGGGGGRGGPGGGRGGGRGDSKTKSSPWGLTPEEKAAKGGKGGPPKTKKA